MSTFFCLMVGAVDTLSMMMLSNAMRISSYFNVVHRNLKFDKLSSISSLTANISSSSLILPNLFSNLVVSLIHVVKMSSSGSTSLARSRSLRLPISAVCVEFLSDMFL